jgi:glutaminyl-tRNA synthetase
MRRKSKNKQREFARMNVSYMITSKRKLQRLVAEGVTTGWDDPRMPTISGMRRKGYTPSIRNFIEKVGVAKRENLIDIQLLSFSVREDLNKIATSVMAVVNPVKLSLRTIRRIRKNGWKQKIILKRKMLEQEIPFSRELYIEKEDFQEEANKKFFRLKLGGEVRLKSAYILRLKSRKNEKGEITTIFATYDEDSRSGSGTEASLRKVKGTLHWVSAKHALPIEIRTYERLFTSNSQMRRKM